MRTTITINDEGTTDVIRVDREWYATIHCAPLPIPPRLAARLHALEAGHWATEGIRGAVYRLSIRNDGRTAARIIHTDAAIGTIEVPNEHT